MQHIKYFILILLIFMYAWSAAFCDSAGIEKITGLLENGEFAYDEDTDTFAVVRRINEDEGFQFFVYLKGTTRVEAITMTTEPVVSASGTQILRSMDIVNWEGVKFEMQSTSEGNGDEKGTVEIRLPSPIFAQFLRLNLKPEKETDKLKIYSFSITSAPPAKTVISNVRAVDITKNSAAIEYTTDAPAVTQVRYSPWAPGFQNVVIDNQLITEHRVELSKLLEGTDYFYQILTSGGAEMSTIYAFRTSGVPLPVILNINLSEVSSDSARCEVMGNVPLKWRFYYGIYEEGMDAEGAKANPRGKVQAGADFHKSGAFVFSGLEPRRRYYFLIEAEDESGKKTGSDLLGFDTLPLNLARGKPVSGTYDSELEDKHITQAADRAGRVTDGDETYFDGFAKSHSPMKGEQWVEVDLGEEKKVAEIEVVWSRLAMPEEYAVSVSSDGAQWENVLEINEKGCVDVAPPNKFGGGTCKFTQTEKRSQRGDPLVVVVTPVDGSVRYIKLTIPKDTPIKSKFGWKTAILAEIKVLAP
ncbi:MAG: discoidin domain-containing protein [bacterium]